ncbi:MAG: MBOAT family protein [Planctomycetes bacterium]|jgi:alginate O-acetyltransferase complex protein AlgI|nr:MBOAT family protein [Phycisphaerae bacterium]NBB96444.1 MBOAT family protein [Planctomycetota bacterium]
MLFSQPVFLLFAAAVFAVLLTVRHNHARKAFLLAASYYFYAYWDWRFCGLLLTSTVVDFCVGQGLKRTDRPGRRRGLLAISLVVNLGLLGFFKYYGFFVESAQALLAPLGWQSESLHIILPVGISFYTFQTLSYTIDVYRRQLPVEDSPLDFALFVAFFPQLVAGPIVRASDFLPQTKELRSLTLRRFHDGLRQFVFGMFKKVVIADHLAMMVDVAYGNADVFSGPTMILATLAYAGQIYCDFSGYSDMAIGVARAIGYDFPENFDHPYLARSPREFWRRWHISLSTWLRDYLYISLGGNRKGRLRTQINLMLTMLLGGLWHGASWTFVFWGGLHGAALAADRATGRQAGDRKPGRATSLVGWVVTMLVVLVGWVFFRFGSLVISGDLTTGEAFGAAWRTLGRMATLAGGVNWPAPWAFIGIGFVGLTHVLELTPLRRLKHLRGSSWLEAFILCLLIWLIVIFYPRDASPFIYFQF